MSRPRYQLHFQHRSCERHISLSEGQMALIGRSAQAQFFLSHSSVSRQHGRLVARADGVELQDLGSRNGFYVNGRRADRLMLGGQSLVQIGRLLFFVCVDRQADALSCARCEGALDEDNPGCRSPAWVPLCAGCLEAQRGRRDAAFDSALEAEGFHVSARHPGPGYRVTATSERGGEPLRIHAVRLPSPGETRALERFRESIRVCARVRHPTVNPIHDIRVADDMLYAVTARPGARSLRQVVESSGPLAVPRALSTTRALLQATDQLSRHKRSHLDMNPDVVWFDDADQVRLAELELGAGFETLSPTGIVAPEQGHFGAPELLTSTSDAGLPADLFSIAGLLVYMLTGAPPYGDATNLAIARATMLGVPLSPQLTAVPPALRRWLKRALSLSAKSRFSSVQRAQQALDDCAMNLLMPAPNDTEACEPDDHEQTATSSAFAGDFLGGQLIEVLRIIEYHAMTGVFEAHCSQGRRTACFMIIRGRVAEARCAEAVGVEAIKALFTLQQGSYHFDPELPAELLAQANAPEWQVTTLLLDTVHEQSKPATEPTDQTGGAEP